LNESFWQKIKGLPQLRRALVLVWESARSWTIASLVLMIFQALLPLAVLYLVKLTIDAVAGGLWLPTRLPPFRRLCCWLSSPA
jgi:hypothetical protein